MLEKAIEIAVEAHRGQIDKAGKIYILHPMRVMLRGKNETEMIVGILHDTVEDTPITLDMLRLEGFSDEILAAVQCITKEKNENYGHFIDRVLQNPLATQVKLYDIEDNLNRDRIPYPTKKDEARFAKYEKYHKVILEKLAEYREQGLI
ncbi:MAG: GTP pyrophosphokinase [Bacteroidales bacterium]|nr:GTP pyrophosphokinase [Clostridium sp.]MCM1203689.1 GTP pyrophosphokinase [Bacteroidales bacterium]